MASISILVLILLLLIVKGGTITYISLTWSGIVICLLTSVMLVNSKLQFIQKTKSESLPCLFKTVCLKPLFWLFFLQCWLIAQVMLGVSRDIQASIDQIVLGVGFLCFLILLGSFQWRQKTIKQFCVGLFLLALMQSIYGLWIFLTQKNMLLWMEKIHYLDKPTGTFVNANHFAAYLALTLVLLCAIYICKEQAKSRSKGSAQGIFYLLEQFYNVYILIAVLLVVALLATRSLGGIGSLLLTFGFAVSMLSLRVLEKALSIKKLFLGVFFVLTVFVILVLFSDYLVLKKELELAAFTLERRFEISRAAFRMIADNWFLGVGAGAFYSSFSQYRDIDVGNSFYHFAHNDFLHFWAEYGLIGIVLCSIFIISCLRLNYKVLQQSRNVYKRSFAYASLYGSLLLAIHSLVDFPLRVPAYALIYLTILCFNVVVFKEKKVMKSKIEERLVLSPKNKKI